MWKKIKLKKFLHISLWKSSHGIIFGRPKCLPFAISVFLDSGPVSTGYFFLFLLNKRSAVNFHFLPATRRNKLFQIGELTAGDGPL